MLNRRVAVETPEELGGADFHSALCPENGRQAGRGAPRVQVTQGPRHPPRPSNRQTGRAGRQGGHVKSQPLYAGWGVGEGGGTSASAKNILYRFGSIELGVAPRGEAEPTFQNLISVLSSSSTFTRRPVTKGKTLAAHVHF